MDVLFKLLSSTTMMFRKGEPVETRSSEGLTTMEIFDMPHIDEARSDLELVDLEMVVIGVDKAKAKAAESDLCAIMSVYPEPDRLTAGPSYIELGAALGSQDAALRLLALGSVVGLWKVAKPSDFGMIGEKAVNAAKSGFLFMAGYKPATS